MTAPSSWYCDECGERIDSAKDGWLEWKVHEGNPERITDFRIVHHATASPRAPWRDCFYPNDERDVDVLDGHLHWFTGIDGLARLLDAMEPIQPGAQLDVESAFEIIRRLHVPQYEEARRAWPRVEAEWSGGMPYSQEQLAMVIAAAAKQDDE